MHFKSLCSPAETPPSHAYSITRPLMNEMIGRRRMLQLGAAVLFAASITAGLATESHAAESASAPLRCSVDAGFVPFSYLNSQGELEGFQVDLFREVARRMHRKIEITQMAHAGEPAAILAGRYQFSCGPTTITEDRAQHMLFVEPYVSVGWQFAIKKGSAPIKSEDDLRGKAVAVNAGAVPSDAWLSQNADRLDIKVMPFSGQSEAVQAVLQGRAYAYYNSTVPVQYLAKTVPQIVASWISPGPPRFWSSTFGPNEVKLRDQVDDTIVCMKRDGFIAKLYEKYLGAPPQKDGATVTTYPGYGMKGVQGFEDRPQDPKCEG